MNLFELATEVHKINCVHSDRFNRLMMEYTDVILLGNGGSNAVALHLAEDYSKVLKKRAVAFGDGPRLTCYFNDYGVDQAYVEFLKTFSTPRTLHILISSSGESQNIINCAKYCKEQGRDMVLLSGFKEKNKLRKFSPHAKLEYWVDSSDYGVVEIAHETYLHAII
jgi:D-sedoheptulose 7-phosphate isomerase